MSCAGCEALERIALPSDRVPAAAVLRNVRRLARLA
jgi:hypothetical protein